MWGQQQTEARATEATANLEAVQRSARGAKAETTLLQARIMRLETDLTAARSAAQRSMCEPFC